jgi:hypothetical protein
MAIYEHITEFAGKDVIDWETGDALDKPEQHNYRLSLDYDEAEEGGEWPDKLAAFLDEPGVERVTGLVIGPWEETYQPGGSNGVVEALVAARDRLPKLTALFFGDIVMEESEISWIQQTDITPLLAAYPRLTHFTVRGGEGLSFGRLRHDQLKELVVQTGGLRAEVVGQIIQAQLPALEHLELWLGDDMYGGDSTVDDLEPLLTGNLFPQLRYLGLRDSHIADEIAAAVAQSRILGQIEVLDLSLGTLGDVGAAALLSGGALGHLKLLDIHHHYCSDGLIARLNGLGIPVNTADRQKEDDYNGESHRYVAVSE